MEISNSKILNNLAAARGRYKCLLESEKKLDKYFTILHQYLEVGKRGEVTDEYLIDQWKRTDKTTKSMLAEKKALEDKIKELEQQTTMQSMFLQRIGFFRSIKPNLFEFSKDCNKIHNIHDEPVHPLSI